MKEGWSKTYGIDGLVQDYSNSIATTLELLQSSTKPSIYPMKKWNVLLSFVLPRLYCGSYYIHYPE